MSNAYGKIIMCGPNEAAMGPENVENVKVSLIRSEEDVDH